MHHKYTYKIIKVINVFKYYWILVKNKKFRADTGFSKILRYWPVLIQNFWLLIGGYGFY